MVNTVIVSKNWLRLSYLNAVLITVSSLLGILNRATYSAETNNWATQALGQDIANLVVVSLLLISTNLLSKGSARAYVVWLGVYFYFIYAFIIYAFAVHFNYLFLVYVAILGISLYVPIGTLLKGVPDSLIQSFTPKISVKPASVLLMTIGVMFSLLWLREIIPSLFSGTRPQGLIETGLMTNPVHVLDLGILLPAMMMTSIMLWKRKLLGYFLAVPLLVFSATMGIGIMVLFMLMATSEGTSIAPPAYAIGLIVILSSYYAYRFILNMGSDNNSGDK